MNVESGWTLILVNPKAREGQLGEKWKVREKEVIDAIGDSRSQIAFTTPEDHGSVRVRQSLQSGAKRIVVVGGDGTLSEAIQGFFENGKQIAPDAVLVVMPAGRGDDFFKTVANQRFYRSQTAWDCALEFIRSGTAQPIDVGRIQWLGSSKLMSRYFINIASFGFPSLVVQRTRNTDNFLAKSFAGRSAWAYALQGIAALREYKPIAFQVKVDDQDFYEGDIFSGFIMNGRFNGGGICWHPETFINDGSFQLVLMKSQDTFTQFKNSIESLFVSWNHVQGVLHTPAKKVQVSLSRSGPKAHPLFEVDGEILEDSETTGASFEILPSTILLQMGQS